MRRRRRPRLALAAAGSYDLKSMTTTYHLHLVSDSTGGTLTALAKACLAQFEGVAVEQHFTPLVRTPQQVNAVAQAIGANPGIVLYTMVDEGLGRLLEQHCKRLGVPAHPVMAPLLHMMSDAFHQLSRAEPGRQHKLDDDYFARMDAVDFALSHDDGQRPDSKLAGADVILVGVSRTSKTPTCVYLANRGIKAANVPLVPDVPFPQNVLEMAKQENGPMFVALTAAPERLVDIRRNRLQQLGESRATGYHDEGAVEDEVRLARQFYRQQGWPVIDVTRRSVEETAAEIITLLARRREGGGS